MPVNVWRLPDSGRRGEAATAVLPAFFRQPAQVWNRDLAVPVVSRLGGNANIGRPIAADMRWRADANLCGSDLAGTAPTRPASLATVPAFARIQRFPSPQHGPLMPEPKLRKKAVPAAGVRVQMSSGGHVKRNGGFRRFGNSRAHCRTDQGQGLASAQVVYQRVKQKPFTGCQSGRRGPT